MRAVQRRQISLALTVVAATAGLVWGLHDTPLLAVLVASAGLLWTSRELRAWLFAAVLVSAGLFWSSLDGSCCSAWWRICKFHTKLTGQLPYVAWSDVGRSMFSTQCDLASPATKFTESIKLVEEKTLNGRKLERFQTTLGTFWIPAPGYDDIKWLVWELMVQSVYKDRRVRIREGDTVVDCGAHVGVFTRFALRSGAARVVVIEPDPVHLACLEANLTQEIADGRVLLVKAGVWDSRRTLTLYQPEGFSLSNTFIFELENRVEGIPVLPLDEIVEELDLDRVDFIKMDIEGSERRAMRGAVKTLKRFRPRMAICTYHRADDPEVLPQIALSAHPDYRVHGKDLDVCHGYVNPKVLFFE